MAVKPIPEGYHTVTPYLIVTGVGRVIDFAKQVFRAEVTERMEAPDGSILHAEIRIGDSRIMMGEAGGPWTPMPACLHLYVTDDVDALYQQALKAGAVSMKEPADQFYGDRSATVKDACGNLWSMNNHKEDVPPDEMQRRAAEYHKKTSGG